MNPDEKFIIDATGFIYPYNEHVASRPGVRVVTAMEAYPGKFIPPALAEAIASDTKSPKAKGKPKDKVDVLPGLIISNDDLSAALGLDVDNADPALGAEASRGMPK